MRLGFAFNGAEFHHDVRGSFGELLRSALRDEPVLVAHGPIYTEDPAATLLAPFVRSAQEAGWPFDEGAVPDWVTIRAHELRRDRLAAHILKDPTCSGFDDIVSWTRAGLVLEVARRHGINVGGRYHHVLWRLCGTVTGRFGVEADSTFNPLVIPEERRHLIRPSDAVRHVAVIDFRAMDLCSMAVTVSGMEGLYGDAPDMHARTAELVGLDRETAKKQVFVHAYGGQSPHREAFERVLPMLTPLRGPDLARLIQATSARAFRGALSRALPLLVDFHFKPMFVVHDEVVLDVSEVGLDRIKEVTGALEEGASQTIGRPYRVKVSTGYTYEEAKR